MRVLYKNDSTNTKFDVLKLELNAHDLTLTAKLLWWPIRHHVIPRREISNYSIAWVGPGLWDVNIVAGKILHTIRTSSGNRNYITWWYTHA